MSSNVTIEVTSHKEKVSVVRQREREKKSRLDRYMLLVYICDMLLDSVIAVMRYGFFYLKRHCYETPEVKQPV
ncbi:Hypothetical predicted protein [Octopus vulgaris]|uniref:Uncharacterized protein n=1 Tax=Octopus vulgaris TaxID=6645 RepID=A0AA36AMB6_OCTVU|nr:Hypothetical predicted protein [Octopus vulgaris]